MSISDEIEKLQDNLEDSYTAVENKGGTLPSNQCFDNLAEAIETIETGGAIETLNVIPTTSAQTINPPTGTDGYAPVNVAAVDATIDRNITPANIVAGKSILGVNGSATALNGETKSVSLTNANGQTFTPSSGKNGITSITVTPNNQSRSVTPTTNQQTLTVNSGYSGNGTVTVGAVDASIDSNIVASKIKKDVVILGVTGSYEGAGASISSLNVTPTTSAQTITASGGIDGYSPINVAAVTASIDSNITASNIVSGKSILGVNGSAVVLNGETRTVSITSTAGNTFTPSSGKNGITSIKVTPTNKTQTITPSKSSQTLSVPTNYSGYGTLTVNAVTASIDSNITAPNIVSGKSILGVNGSAVVLNGQTKTVNPTTSQQTITPDSPKNGLTSVTINAVDSSIDSHIKPSFIRKNVNILGVVGTYGEEPLRLRSIATGYNTGYITEEGNLYICGSNNSAYNYLSSFTYVDSDVIDYFGFFYANNYYSKEATTGDYYDIYEGNTINGFTKILSNVKKFVIQRNLYSTNTYMTSSMWYIDSDDILHKRLSNGTDTQVANNAKDITLYSNDTTFFIDNNNDLYGYGNGYNGTLGDGNGSSHTTNTFAKIAENVKQYFNFANITWYLDTNNNLYASGWNNYGQQGTNNTTSTTTFQKRVENVKQCSISWNSTWYIDNNNDLYGCGRNDQGQQGSGNTTDVLTFTKRASNVRFVKNTVYTTWYIDNNNDLYGCGYNYYGQQGTGDTTNVTTFRKVASNVRQFECDKAVNWGSWYVTYNDELYGCGNAQYGLQGNGSTSGKVITFTKRN